MATPATPENSDTVTPLRNPDGDAGGEAGGQAGGQGGIGYRAPPHNFEAEMALLGAILANNRAYEKVSEFLLAEHFADAAHGRIFAAAAKLIEHGQIADPITLRNYFEQDGALAEIGGPEYLARLAASVVTFINAEDYGRAIFDGYLRRELIDIAEGVANRAYDFDLDLDALGQIEVAEQGLYDLATTGDVDGGPRPFRTALTAAINMAEAAYKRESHVTGVASGFSEIDRMLGGLHPSELIVIAGRPSMGKTALATNIAFAAARSYREERDEAGEVKVVDGAVVGFFSLEMSAEELATRILADVSKVSSHKIRAGDVNNDDFTEFVKASQTLSAIPLFIDDTPALTLSSLRTRARRLKRQHGLALIVVDYLQLMHPPRGSRPENRVQEISEITRGLKAIAKELKVAVVALSQLSRAVEQREDKRPLLSDLRESGAIEQDSDVVMFIYREEYYLKRQQPPDGTEKHIAWQTEMERVHNVAEVIIAKQRHGPVGTVRLHFDEKFTRFSDLVEDTHLPDGAL